VVAGQLSDRSTGSLQLTAAGLCVDRVGAPPVFVPAAALQDARLDSVLAGKVMGADRLLVVTWEHRGELLDSAFRADQHAVHVAYVHAVLDLIRAGHGGAVPDNHAAVNGAAVPDEGTAAPNHASPAAPGSES
jgi:hypothetical protein